MQVSGYERRRLEADVVMAPQRSIILSKRHCLTIHTVDEQAGHVRGGRLGQW